jgi:hypothetical protein
MKTVRRRFSCETVIFRENMDDCKEEGGIPPPSPKNDESAKFNALSTERPKCPTIF